MSLIPVLEIGGTHVTGALVDPDAWGVVPGSLTRDHLDAAGTADELIAALAACAGRVTTPPGAHWGVGLPGPFDHATGVARYTADKFTALNGVDLGAALRARIQPAPAAITFSDDAEDFLIGEWLAGAATGHDRIAGITLGTGIGSAFLAAGQIVSSGDDVPPGGDVYRLEHQGQPIEESVSRRAIRAHYAAAARTATQPDVHEIAERARSGTDPIARQVFDQDLTLLGQLLAPWLTRFGATVLVVGGSIARSWDLVHPALQAPLPAVKVVAAQAGEAAPILGAAWHALRPAAGLPDHRLQLKVNSDREPAQD